MMYLSILGALILVVGIVELWVRVIEPKIPTNHDDIYDDRE